jgi:anti-sigma factor RsiW
MSENRMFLDQDTLVAYVDQELPADRRASVEAALVHDAEAWETVRLLRLSADAAARALGHVLDEPVPARLRAAAEGRLVSGAFGRGPAPGQAGSPWPSSARGHGAGLKMRWALPLAASLAALAIGLGGGFVFRGLGQGQGLGGAAAGGYAPASAAAADPLAARFESALLAALEQGADGQILTYGTKDSGDGRIELGRAFSTGFGSACREFHREETRAGKLSHADGLACRGSDKAWNVMILPAAG